MPHAVPASAIKLLITAALTFPRCGSQCPEAQELETETEYAGPIGISVRFQRSWKKNLTQEVDNFFPFLICTTAATVQLLQQWCNVVVTTDTVSVALQSVLHAAARLIYTASIVTTTLHHCCSSCTGCQCQNDDIQTLRHGVSLSAWYRPWILLGRLQARVRDSLSPATALGLQYRRRGTRRSSLGDRAFPVAGARAWNALPASVTAAPSSSSFRRFLKTWFLFQRQRCQ